MIRNYETELSNDTVMEKTSTHSALNVMVLEVLWIRTMTGILEIQLGALLLQGDCNGYI